MQLPKIEGESLRMMRKEAGLTSTQAAKLAGVKNRRTIYNWEKNITEPTINQFLSIMTGCGFTVKKFVKLNQKVLRS